MVKMSPKRVATPSTACLGTRQRPTQLGFVTGPVRVKVGARIPGAADIVEAGSGDATAGAQAAGAQELPRLCMCQVEQGARRGTHTRINQSLELLSLFTHQAQLCEDQPPPFPTTCMCIHELQAMPVEGCLVTCVRARYPSTSTHAACCAHRAGMHSLAALTMAGTGVSGRLALTLVRAGMHAECAGQPTQRARLLRARPATIVPRLWPHERACNVHNRGGTRNRRRRLPSTHKPHPRRDAHISL